MNKIIILSTVIFAINISASDLGESKRFNLKEKHNQESVKEVKSEKVEYDTLGKRRLTIDEVYKKFSNPKEAERYIRVNEMGLEFEKISIGKE